MSETTNTTSNIYHAEYQSSDEKDHSRKGKNMKKHSKNKLTKKILRFKAKEQIDSKQWLSAHDVYKAKLNKKRKRISVETVRSKGNDYKFFVSNNEIPQDNEELDDDDSYDDDSYDLPEEDDWWYYSD